jgi:hypothetical protein
MTSPVIRNACSAVTSATVPLVKSDRCSTPKVRAQGLFQLHVKGAAVGQNLVGPDIFQKRNKLLQRWQVRLGDKNRGGLAHRAMRVGGRM